MPLYNTTLEPDTLTVERVQTVVVDQKTLKLVVWNDEVNTFDWVIQSLIEICEHTTEQAEQCAWIIHTKGKYAVKHGSRKELTPMREALTDRGIGATVEG